MVIDPGHNGANGAHPEIINDLVDAGFGETKPCNTTGTETNDGYPEHEFTWAVANHVRDILQGQGIVVVMTRDSDDGVGPCVNERAAIGNENNAAAVVSIHGDGSSQGDRGFYAMTAQREPAGDDMAALSLDLATEVRDKLVDAGLSPSNYVGSGGLWTRDDLAGLNLSVRPTTMIEMGNMRDTQDSALMTSRGRPVPDGAGHRRRHRRLPSGCTDTSVHGRMPAVNRSAQVEARVERVRGKQLLRGGACLLGQPTGDDVLRLGRPARRRGGRRGRVSTSTISSATRSKSAASKPREVSAGVPIRMPEVYQAPLASRGIELRLVTMPESSRANSACRPVSPNEVTSNSTRWFSVPPVINRTPRLASPSARATALSATACA